jgi:hypothetical protein
MYPITGNGDMEMKYYIYDIETLPNIFTMWVKVAGENK